MEVLNSCNASFSKLLRGLNGFASMLDIGSDAIDPTIPEDPVEDVMSVSELSNKAPSPFPRADRFFELELIANLYFFVFV
mmetsp:Transcript_19433/g.26289  ORF Transcript_19433/g.26289 Transcript_19433/m.26289 type:complete len:80 (+) Transcript_19433:811-1050(+)